MPRLRRLVLASSLTITVVVAAILVLAYQAKASSPVGLVGSVSWDASIVEPLEMLPSGLAKPAAEISVVKDPAVARMLGATGGAAVLEAHVEEQRLFIVFTRGSSGVEARVYDEHGNQVPARLVVLKRFEKSEPVMAEAAEPPGLDVGAIAGGTGVDVGEAGKAVERSREVYRRLRAYRKVSAESYLLEAMVGGRYTPLGYYVRVTEGYTWVLPGVGSVYSVTSDGLFYVNPGSSVALVADWSYSTVGFPFSECSFSTSTTGSQAVAVTLRADGKAALLDCPVTTRVKAWAAVTVDKNGSIFRNSGGSKWIAIGCGCNSYSP